ncbi:MAG: lipopolysaccharide transport periplasmic protein LptA [Proteobacteria bacterium]|nr:lipopolysaccharide transport periplasmic protein LptA [Pseudomonadota bacterium]
MDRARRILPATTKGVFLLILGLAFTLPTPSAMAQSGLSGGAFDTSQPLEIQADSLEVQQENQLAIFEGKVEVVQGEIRMRANKLVVHYSDKKSSNQDGPTNIRKIDASGKVFLSSPRETAQGDKGTYDVQNKRVDLEGNVVLTQGSNVLRGSSMTLNLVTGKSRVEGGPVSEGKPGRVKGIFVPEPSGDE